MSKVDASGARQKHVTAESTFDFRLVQHLDANGDGRLPGQLMQGIDGLNQSSRVRGMASEPRNNLEAQFARFGARNAEGQLTTVNRSKVRPCVTLALMQSLSFQICHLV